MTRNRNLGQNVCNLMKQNNISVKQLSDLLECSENQFYAFLKGRKFLSFSQLSKISKILNVSVQDLLNCKKMKTILF